MLTATCRGGSLALKAMIKDVANSTMGPLDAAVGTVRTIGTSQHRSTHITTSDGAWETRRRHTLPLNRPSTAGDVRRRQLSTIHKNPKQAASTSLKGGGGGGVGDPSPSLMSADPVTLAYISYERKDSAGKSPLVVHHGLFGCKENWKKVAKEVNLISKRSVFSVDGRNHGESPHSPEMSLPIMASDLHHFVNQIGLEKVSFMGHNFGGRVGMMVALMYPKVVDRLVVVDTSPLPPAKGSSHHGHSPLLHATAVLKNMEPELRGAHGFSRGLKAEKAIEHILKETRDRAVVLSNLHSGQQAIKPREVTTNGVKQDPNSLWRVNLDAILSNPCLTDFPDFGPGSTFEGKTLFIQGQNSPNLKQSDEPRIRRLFPNAEFVWLEETGPWIHLEKPKEFLQHVLKFLEKKD